MFYRVTYKNWETTQFRICHYDPFAQTVRLKQAIELMNTRLYQCSIGYFMWRPTQGSMLPATYIYHNSIIVQHLIYSRQWSVPQQYTENAMSCFHCNNGYANAQQCYCKYIAYLVLNVPLHLQCYCPFWAFASLRRRFYSSLSSARLLRPLIPIDVSLRTTSSRLVLGFPTDLALSNFSLRTFTFGILSPSISISFTIFRSFYKL